MSKVKVKNGQSLIDIAVQSCGSADAVFDLALANDNSLSDVLTNGQELSLTDVDDYNVVNCYTRKNIFPATAITTSQFTSTIGGEGIEFWGIEIDFIVS